MAGPRSRDVLSGLTDTDLSKESFKWLTARVIDVAGVSVRALRVNYLGELGWELHCPMGRLPQFYDAVWNAGQSHEIANFGIYAVNSLRMEKAYEAWGAELTNEIALIEADMERFFAADKGEFTGRDATLKVKEAGITTKLVYLEVEPGESDVHGGEPVFDGDRPIGVTTSGGHGHCTAKSLGFAYVEPDYAVAGRKFDLELLGKRCWAKVLAERVWDPNSERPRS